MKKIKLKTSNNAYNIIVGSSILNHFPRLIAQDIKIPNTIIITNALIKRKYARKINSVFKGSGISLKYLLVPDSETSKSFKYFSQAVNRIAKLSDKKPIFIIALGGGVIGDLSGFVAAVYKRGIPCVQIPTTLLAQVDSSIGGKTAIDLEVGKNLVGAFYQPALVLSDIDFLETLGKRQIKSGLAEIIKYGIIMDKPFFNYLANNNSKVLKLDRKALEYVVYRCSINKAKIVEQDEKEEKGLRTILNFGHTFGHAFEAAGKYNKYSHGEAVAVGMVCALNLSRKLKLIDGNQYAKALGLIKSCGLPIKVKGLKLSSILKCMQYDKKFIRGKNRLVLIKDIGKAIVKENVNPALIKEVVKDVLVP